MKVERKEVEFQPVTITLESQEEVDQLFALANHMCFYNKPDVTERLYSELEEIYYHDYYLLDGTNRFIKEG